MATLLVESPNGPLAIQIHRASVIGRDESCFVQIDHPTLSRHHARLVPTHDGQGTWKLEDMGSQNGCRVDGKRVKGTVELADGVAIQFGRVRAWFFIENAPIGWQPEESTRNPDQEGQTIQCPHCGKANWAPNHAAGLQLKCKACKKPIVVESKPPAECAACHSPIEPGEPAHECPECHAIMHETCWTENRGCATYGCSQVNALDQITDTMPTDAGLDYAGTTATGAQLEIAVLVLASIAGLATFGAAAAGAGVWLLTRKSLAAKTRTLLIVIAFVCGAVGVASGFWWLGWFRG